ncbi:uncharacterized protein EV420DRAFT_1578459 [Desarmillaria tabescens]|uniref:Uncharacterized protein n=1 Tax=Armillaria tabescens TaxID=1929756 RepID=A0AA39MPP6_ARMTA|nr:uncharacterized protein EV420DRAFT_1578459 [Desarmillaria tabescens]KAK0442531.1 hypothetical protein EV420DRAFT_1578459 [Desarmillaria tabescens]
MRWAPTRSSLSASTLVHSKILYCCVPLSQDRLLPFADSPLPEVRSSHRIIRRLPGPRPVIGHLTLFRQGKMSVDMTLLLLGSFFLVGFNSLRISDICIYTQQHFNSLQEFLASATTPLEELIVYHVEEYFRGPIDSKWLDISLILDNVRSLTLTFDDCIRSKYSDEVFFKGWTRNIKCCGHNNKLRHVTLRGRPYFILGFHTFDMDELWDSLGTALNEAEVETMVEVHPTFAQEETSDGINARGSILRKLSRSVCGGVNARTCIVNPEALEYDLYDSLGPF